MAALAASLSPQHLGTRAYELYERLHPVVPAGVKGWGAFGEFDLSKLRSLARGQ